MESSAAASRWKWTAKRADSHDDAKRKKDETFAFEDCGSIAQRWGSMEWNDVRVDIAIHVRGLFDVGEVEGVEETRRDGANARDEHATIISGLGLDYMDAARIEEELARAKSKVRIGIHGNGAKVEGRKGGREKKGRA